MNRFNLYTSIDVMASPAPGYATGDVLKAVSEVASSTLSAGYGYDYSGLTREEQGSSDTTALIFGLCLLFVYLILSAQYESYLLPFSVILSIPFGLAGAFIFSNIFGHTNNIYMQIALIMLIGLLAKECHPQSLNLLWTAAAQVCRSRGVRSSGRWLVCAPS